jgi:hypothetical protein
LRLRDRAVSRAAVAAVAGFRVQIVAAAMGTREAVA